MSKFQPLLIALLFRMKHTCAVSQGPVRKQASAGKIGHDDIMRISPDAISAGAKQASSIVREAKTRAPVSPDEANKSLQVTADGNIEMSHEDFGTKTKLASSIVREAKKSGKVAADGSIEMRSAPSVMREAKRLKRSEAETSILVTSAKTRDQENYSPNMPLSAVDKSTNAGDEDNLTNMETAPIDVRAASSDEEEKEEEENQETNEEGVETHEVDNTNMAASLLEVSARVVNEASSNERASRIEALMAQNPNATRDACDACVNAEEELVARQAEVIEAEMALLDATKVHSECLDTAKSCEEEETKLKGIAKDLEASVHADYESALGRDDATAASAALCRSAVKNAVKAWNKQMSTCESKSNLCEKTESAKITATDAVANATAMQKAAKASKTTACLALGEYAMNLTSAA